MNIDLESITGALTLLRDFERMEKLVGRIEAVVANPLIREFTTAIRAITEKGRDGFPQVTREFLQALQLLIENQNKSAQAIQRRLKVESGTPPEPEDAEPEPNVYNPDIEQAKQEAAEKRGEKKPTRPRGTPQPIMPP